MAWIIEPPSKNSALIDDTCRIVEVDEDGNFVKVIAKLHRDVTPESAAIMCCVVEMFDCIRMIDEDLDGRAYPEEDTDESENDIILDCIEDRVTSLLDFINEMKGQST